MEAVFRIEGRFDVEAAMQLREQTIVAGMPAMVIDFCHAAQVDDSTLALLTVNLVLLVRRGYDVELRGLRAHQCRVLEHLGVALGEHGRVRIAHPS